MPYLVAIIALILGTLIGLQLPDADRVFSLFLVHRSIITHGFLLPLGLFLLAQGRERWLQLGAAGVSLAVAVHLAFDLFPRQWYGYALIHAPLFGYVGSTLSVLWLAASMVVCCLLALRLLRDRRDLALALVAMGWGFVTVMGRERTWLLPLSMLLLTLFLASCFPNPVLDGRTATRRWTAAVRGLRRP